MALIKKLCLKREVTAALICLALLAMPASVWAFAQGYITNDTDLRPGMSVALSESSTAEKPQVERASQENPQKILGVATDVGQNLATSASGAHKAYVQSSGTVEAFVSNLNGDVKQGDTLTISPLKGILMRTGNNSASIGVALENFADNQSETQSVATSNGEQRVLVAKLKTSVAFSLPGEQPPMPPDNKSILENIGKSVAGKDVSSARVAAALVIFIIVMVAEGSIIYGAISSSIISLGRNPFSKGVIRAELVRVLGLVIIVLFVGLASIYAVLSI